MDKFYEVILKSGKKFTITNKQAQDIISEIRKGVDKQHYQGFFVGKCDEGSDYVFVVAYSEIAVII